MGYTRKVGNLLHRRYNPAMKNKGSVSRFLRSHSAPDKQNPLILKYIFAIMYLFSYCGNPFFPI